MESNSFILQMKKLRPQEVKRLTANPLGVSTGIQCSLLDTKHWVILWLFTLIEHKSNLANIAYTLRIPTEPQTPFLPLFCSSWSVSLLLLGGVREGRITGLRMYKPGRRTYTPNKGILPKRNVNFNASRGSIPPSFM